MSSYREMAEFARAWSRGNRAFKKLYDTTQEDKALILIRKDVWKNDDETSKKLRSLATSCQAKDIEEYVKFATPHHAAMARFTLIYCMGKKIVNDEEEAREALVAPGNPPIEEQKSG